MGFILNLFGGGQAKMIGIVLVILTIVGIVFTGYHYVTKLQNDNVILQTNNALYQTTIEANKVSSEAKDEINHESIKEVIKIQQVDVIHQQEVIVFKTKMSNPKIIIRDIALRKDNPEILLQQINAVETCKEIHFMDEGTCDDSGTYGVVIK